MADKDVCAVPQCRKPLVWLKITVWEKEDPTREYTICGDCFNLKRSPVTGLPTAMKQHEGPCHHNTCACFI